MTSSILQRIFALLLITMGLAVAAQADEPLAQPERMQARIDKLGTFGANQLGGASRVAYSEADIQGREYLMGLMRDAGLAVRIDPVGNIIGRRAGRNNQLAPIMFGSHSDSVPEGGHYDGPVGVIGAIEAIDVLNERGITTERPLEVIIFQNEEGGTVGSLALIGGIGAAALEDVSHSGFTFAEGITRIGGDPAKFTSTRLDPLPHAFVELHIEQGGKLEAAGRSIGVVEGIVGIKWWQIDIQGMANHGGTTPMPGRRDALVAGAKLVVAVNELANQMEGAQVATVGKINAEPGAPNVIPGRVSMSLEIRDLSSAVIERLFAQIQQAADAIADEMQVNFEFTPSNVDIVPAPTHPNVRALVAEAAKQHNYSYQMMPSGAGHDAQNMAKIVPTGMIFVPSRAGISHAASEYTSAEDMAKGANVLINTVLALDQHTF